MNGTHSARSYAAGRKHIRSLNAAARTARQPDITRCAPGGCQYLTRNDDGKLEECGRPAKFKLNRAGGLLYCENCYEYVRRHFDIRPLREHEIAAFAKSAADAQPGISS